MEEALTDDQSHYEISLTAGQAFVAFVLLLLSLAASFAFGLLIGRGQADERMAMRKDVPVVTEAAAAVPAPKKAPAKRAEVKPTITEVPGAPALAGSYPAEAGAPSPPAYAQLLSTSDQKTAEALAAKLIEGGFTAAYVERTTSEKGIVFRVRIKFPNDADARAAEGKLKQFSKEVWITR